MIVVHRSNAAVNIPSQLSDSMELKAPRGESWQRLDLPRCWRESDLPELAEGLSQCRAQVRRLWYISQG